MGLKFVVPDMAETFGKIRYAGEGGVLTERYGRNTTVIGRSYHLYSSKQRTGDAEMVVAAEVGEKDFDQDQPLKAVNPHLATKGYEIENRGSTDYVLYVDDLVKAQEEKKMKLTEDVVVDSGLTFGKSRFSVLRREVRKQNEDGTVNNKAKERTYNLKSSTQGRMIQVSIPTDAPLREFAYDAEVELVNPIMDTVANYVFQEGTTVNQFIKTDDLVLKRQPDQGNSINQNEGRKQVKRIEINVEHILDCPDQYGKGELTEEQLTKTLTYDEKTSLIMHQRLLGVGNDVEEDFNALNWLGEEESFFVVIEVSEGLRREAETALEEIGVEMPDAIEVFLKQLVETKQLPVTVNDQHNCLKLDQ